MYSFLRLRIVLKPVIVAVTRVQVNRDLAIIHDISKINDYEATKLLRGMFLNLKLLHQFILKHVHILHMMAEGH